MTKRKPLFTNLYRYSSRIPSAITPVWDDALRNRVDNYLNEKCVTRAFTDDPRPLYYALQGVKTAMWRRVIKPELTRMAQAQNHYIEMLVENTKMEWIEFQFVELPVEVPKGVRRQEPPLTDEELRAVRNLIKERERERENNG